MGKRSSLSFGGFCNHSIGKLVATAQIPRALPLKWLTNTSKWVEQWPLPQMKLEALEQLVQEQPTWSYRALYLPLEFSCFSYKKEIWKMENVN